MALMIMTNASILSLRSYCSSWKTIYCGAGFFKSFIDTDAPAVESGVASAPVLDWNPALKVEMYPCYAHGKGVNKDQYFHIGIIDKDETYKYSNIPYIDVFGNVKTKDAIWYGAGNALIHNSGRNIDAKGIVSSNQIWVAYWTWAYNTSSQTKTDNNNNMANLKSFEIKNYKELIVGEHTYWCFDCNNDNDYSDFICLVQNVDPVKPTIKRYMVEDLGSIGDFDFNDICYNKCCCKYHCSSIFEGFN